MTELAPPDPPLMINLPLEPPRPSPRSLLARVFLESVGRLLPGDHIHYEANKTAPTAISMECKDAAALKRMRKLQKSRAKQ